MLWPRNAGGNNNNKNRGMAWRRVTLASFFAATVSDDDLYHEPGAATIDFVPPPGRCTFTADTMFWQPKLKFAQRQAFW